MATKRKPPVKADKPKAKKPKPAPKLTGPSGGGEAASWIAALGLSTAGKTRWNVNIALDIVDSPADSVYSGDTATRFHLDVYRDEWGVVFVHKGKSSHVRRADSTFVNGSDAHELLAQMPQLADIGAFVRALEAKHGIAFQRPHALVRSNLAGAKAAIATWLATL